MSDEPLGIAAGEFDYGNTTLRVLLWPHGTLVAGRLANGGMWAEIDRAGKISAKLGWWRLKPGKLTISGRRLDAEARPLRASASAGYGDRGFQPSTLVFPTTGCWSVTGHLGDSALRFVVLVTKSRYAR
jgi:hypothetical protein